MRPWLGLLLATSACVSAPRVVLPADATIAAAKEAPLQIGEQRRTAESPFRPDALVPCSDEEDRAEARKAVESLSAEIQRFDESTPMSTLRRAEERLNAILGTPCFELAKADLREPLEFDSAFALRTWWWEAGGATSLLRRVEKEDGESYPYVTIAGQPRPSLLLVGHEEHPLAPLLCAPSEFDCGRETAGFVRRTAPAFQNHGARRPGEDCEKNALNLDPEDRWASFMECTAESAPTETMLPLGRFKAMKEGYFVITHAPWNNCGAVHVYDLATGTFIESTTCSRNPVAIGRVPLATIREAAWVMAFAGFAKDDVRQATSAAIPERIFPGRTRESLEGESIHLGSIHTRSARAAWTWYRPRAGKLVAQVTGLTYGGPSHVAASYANDLLRIAHDSFDMDCAPAFSSATLASIPWNQTGPMLTDPAAGLPFDFQTAALEAARRAIPNAKTPKKCAGPM